MRVSSFTVKGNADSFKTLINKELEEDFEPTLCIAYTDSLFPYKAAAEVLGERNIQLLGTTTAGEVSDDKVCTDSFSGLLLDIQPDYYDVIIEHFEKGEEGKAAERIAHIAKEKFANPGVLVYASGIGTNGDAVVNGLKDNLSEGAGIFGGLGGDSFRYTNISVFTTDKEALSGVGAVIFDCDKVRMSGDSFSGWEGLGRTHTITKSERNIIHEIDGVPALELFESYFGDLDYVKQDGSDTIFLIPGIYPLKVDEDAEEYMRSVLLYDDKSKSLILAGEVKNGHTFRFCPTPDFTTVKSTVNHFKKVADRIGEVDCVIINSCVGRNVAFGPMFAKEIKHIYDIWNVPTSGILALGEIGNFPGGDTCGFHNVTCNLLTLTEYT